MKEKSIKLYIFPAIIAIIFLLLTFFDWPYAFYNILRIVVTIVAIYYAYYLYKVIEEGGLWFYTLLVIAFLFNPIFPIYLYDKFVWGIIDVVVVIIFIMLIFKFKKKYK